MITSSRFWRWLFEARKNWPTSGRSPRIGHFDTSATFKVGDHAGEDQGLSFAHPQGPVSSRRTLRMLICGVQAGGPGTVSVTAEIDGDREKVTKPLSSIFSTRAPRISPAVESSSSHWVPPF